MNSYSERLVDERRNKRSTQVINPLLMMSASLGVGYVPLTLVINGTEPRFLLSSVILLPVSRHIVFTNYFLLARDRN